MLGIEIGGAFGRGSGAGGRGGWWILDEPELHLRRDVLVPDIAGWRRERMPKLPSVPAFEMAPDWVCEVISPSTMRFDRSRKLRIYKREKVSHVWIVDPLARTLEVFRLDGKSWTLVAVHGEEADEKVRAEPFDAIELEPARWWLPDEPKVE